MFDFPFAMNGLRDFAPFAAARTYQSAVGIAKNGLSLFIDAAGCGSDPPAALGRSENLIQAKDAEEEQAGERNGGKQGVSC